MEEKLLTIIVPTYNMEMYLERCISSVVNSIFSESIEVIVVNDGSKDNSLAIAKVFLEKFPNIIRVIDKENGNYGSCFNAAFPNVKGKYVRLLDADDYVNTNGLDCLLSEIADINVDAIFTHYETINAQGKRTLYKTQGLSYRKILNGELLNNSPLENFAMHHITYRTDLFRKIGYKQTEGISYTDTEYVFYPLGAIKTFYVADILLYRYLIGREFQTVDSRSRISHSSDYKKIFTRMLQTITTDSTNRLSQACERYAGFVLATYYHTLLVLQPLSEMNKLEIENLDLCLYNKYRNLYNITEEYKCLGFRYIHYWRKYKIQIIPSKLYYFLKRIFK